MVRSRRRLSLLEDISRGIEAMPSRDITTLIMQGNHPAVRDMMQPATSYRDDYLVFLAVYYGHRRIVETLLNNGYTASYVLQVTAERQYTTLECAALNNNARMIKTICAFTLNKSLITVSMLTEAMIVGIFCDFTDVVKKLLKCVRMHNYPRDEIVNDSRIYDLLYPEGAVRNAYMAQIVYADK